MSEGNLVVPGGFAPGSRIAGYLLEEQIGQGGMAVVFRAHDERLDRTVALKILAPALAADEAFRQRFIRESRAAAAVDDPHIIPVFEAGEASGVLFIAMRFVRGGDVRSLVGQFGPLPPGRVAEITSQVASALDAAHGRGLVHRDVKPANMLLDSSSGAGRPDHVYLSDFGLSKGSLQASGLTGTGTFLGTLDYISPEQIEGKPVDGRADEYALACAAFELLTGVPPFQRDEAMAVMYAQLSEPPPPVTNRRPDLTRAVDAVFARALAKTPADRYASCREFSDALREAFGIRPYDSGPNVAPSGEHPATQVVRPSSGPGGAAAAGGFGGGYTPPGGHGAAPPGYPGGGGQPVGAGYPGGSGYGGSGTAGGQGGYAGPGQGQGPGGPAGPGGPPAGAGSGGHGGFGAAQTQLAGGGRSTSPDLTAQQQYAGEGGGGYGDYPAGGGRRPWWRSPFALIGVLVLLIAGGAVYASVALGGSSGGGNKHHPVTSIAVPGCSTATAASTTLSAKTSSVPVPNGRPFGVVASKDGKAVFVASDDYLSIFKTGPGGTVTADGWRYPIGGNTGPGVATTMVMTSDGKYLLVASNNGIQVLDANGAESGASTINVVTLALPGQTKDRRAIGVAVTPDSRYAFVSVQHANKVAVFDLAKSLSTRASQYLGSLNVGPQPVGLTMSPDGKTLYATNFVNDQANVPGKLSVIDVAKATSPGEQKSALISQVQTGCGAARLVVTPDGGKVWVTLRQSNAVLGYSASILRSSNPGKALQFKAQIGQQPVGLALVNGGSRLIAADTDGVTNPSAADQNLAVIDASGSGQPKLLGYIPSGADPHELAVSPDGKYLYVTDRDASQLQVVKLSTIP